jgi:hypothetical protein
VCDNHLWDWTSDGEKIAIDIARLNESAVIGINGEGKEIVKGIGCYSLDGKLRLGGFRVFNAETGTMTDTLAGIKRQKYKGHFVYKRPDNIW